MAFCESVLPVVCVWERGYQSLVLCYLVPFPQLIEDEFFWVHWRVIQISCCAESGDWLLINNWRNPECDEALFFSSDLCSSSRMTLRSSLVSRGCSHPVRNSVSGLRGAAGESLPNALLCDRMSSPLKSEQQSQSASWKTLQTTSQQPLLLKTQKKPFVLLRWIWSDLLKRDTSPIVDGISLWSPQPCCLCCPPIFLHEVCLSSRPEGLISL